MNACKNVAVTTSASSVTSEYIRVSRAKCVRNGLVAASTAAIRAARRSKRLRPAQYPAGMHSVAKRSDSAWVATSLLPNTCIQRCSAR